MSQFVFHDIDPDFIPTASNMGERECLEMIERITRETVRAQQALAIAKKQKDWPQVSHLGHMLAYLGGLRSPINNRYWHIQRTHDSEILSQAIRELCSPEMTEVIFKRVGDERRRRLAALMEEPVV